MFDIQFDIKIGRSADGARRLIVYLRRSQDRQENGIYVQLDWAIETARKLGLELDASKEDLDHMVANDLHEYKDIYHDSGITGAELDRPGIIAARARAKMDKSIAGFLVHELDRTSRPEIAIEAMQRDLALLYAGVTIITSRKVFECRLPGRLYIGDDITMLFNYYEAGDYLPKLAVRLLNARIRVAKDGFRPGGSAPYGFKRVLVNAAGEVVMDLPRGRTVREPGCHVQLRIDDPAKIAVWLEILRMYGEWHWGHQRIAGELNRRGIPPISAGRTLKDGKTPISKLGLWSESSVRYLLDHAAIIGVSEFGRRATGRHRRLGANGAEELTSKDRNDQGKRIRRNNPPEVVIKTDAGYESQVEASLYGKVRHRRDEIRDSQRGQRRAKDPAQFPLAGGLMIDANCGSNMYGLTRRSVYICGKYCQYMDDYGHKPEDRCNCNTVDAEASLRLAVSVLRQENAQSGGRELVAKKVRELLSQSGIQQHGFALSQANIDRLQREISVLEEEVRIAEENLALQSDPKRRDAVGRVFDRKSAELEAKCAELEQARKTLPSCEETDIESRIAAAMAIYDRFDQIIETKPLTRELRIELQPVLKSLGFKIHCRFGSKLKGARPVRAFLSGTLVLGNRPENPLVEERNGDSTGPNGPTGEPDPDEDSGKEKSLTPKTAISSRMGHNAPGWRGDRNRI